MTSPTTLWKPKLHFDTDANPSHVAFDDGKEVRQIVPWLHFVNARWDYNEPEVIKIRIGEWIVVMHGQNLGPLDLAMEKRTLARVRAQPDLAGDQKYEMDTFVISLRFTEPPVGGIGAKGRKQIELDLGG
jgi:hypothetical protein